MPNRTRIKKTDIILIAALLLLAGVLFALGRSGKSKTAAVTVDGKLLYSIPLDEVKEPYTITLENGVTLAVEPGSIRFAASDCRGQNCVNCGALRRAGQAAACVPNKTVITISGKPDKNAPDALSW